MLEKIKNVINELSEKYRIKQLGTLFSRAQLGYVGPTFAYYTLLTIIPTIMAIIMLISMTSLDKTAIITMVQNMLPSDIGKVLIPIIKTVLDTKDLSVLSISLPLTLWAVSRVIAVFRKTFNMIADAEEQISTLLTRFWSFLWLLVLIAVFGLLMVGSDALSIIAQQFPDNQWFTLFQHQVRWLVWVGLLFALMMLNYFLPTQSARVPFKFVAIGSFVELLLLNGLNIGFTWYAKIGLKQYNFYHSVGSIIVLLIWLDLIATIIVVGYILIQWLAGFSKTEQTA